MGLLPNPWLILGVVLAWIGTAIAGYSYGSHTRGEHDAANLDKAVIAAQNAAIARQAAADKITLDAAVKEAQSQQLVEHTFSTIEQKVPVYVAKTDSCSVSNGYLRLWNSGVTGKADTLSGPPGQSDAAASGATAVDALNNAISNFHIAHENEEQLRNLQNWIIRQEQVK